MENFLEIGQIVNSYGLKGQMKIVPFTDDITRYSDLKTIYIEGHSGKPEGWSVTWKGTNPAEVIWNS